MKIEVRYAWRHMWGGRMVRSRYKMTDEQAREHYENAVRVDESREEVMVWDQPCEVDVFSIDMGHRSGPMTHVYLSRLYRPKTLPQEDDYVKLPLAADQYEVTRDGDSWTVTSIASDWHRVVYCGAGPVRVEPAP